MAKRSKRHTPYAIRNTTMYVDFLTLACLRDHLDSLLGARIQGVVLPDDRSVGLELYAGGRFYLLASAQPQQPRLLLLPEKPRRGVETETPLLLLLRKWVRGGAVDGRDPAALGAYSGLAH
jgi:predicted ribosome quality control (RQC) complex YloA/Tae2 family protein